MLTDHKLNKQFKVELSVAKCAATGVKKVSLFLENPSRN